MDFKVEWHEKLGSTNTYIREHFARHSKLKTGTVISAREQTAGRGRQERQWLSAPNTNLCFSLFIETRAELTTIPSLTMAASLAVTDLLKAERIPAEPKWPNDVLVNGKKICGILSERIENVGIIIGIGLNVNMSTEEAEIIDRPATSMLIESNHAHNIDSTLDALLPFLDFWIGEWEKGGFAGIRKAWTEQAGPIGKQLTVHDGDIKKTGKLAGFGEHGELLLETKNGIETIWSGDVAP